MMSERKQQILQKAVEIITTEGYGSLTMRALARASDLKLGALQYHFKTREDMLRGLVSYVAGEYQKVFNSISTDDNSVSLVDIIQIVAAEPADGALQEDKLFTQLWAMCQVEPLIEEITNQLYAEYLQLMETALEGIGSDKPRVEAICLMSMIEGATIFTGTGRPWEEDKEAVMETAFSFLETKYGDKIYTYKFNPEIRSFSQES